ncbi:uncharacterized protein LOC128989604 [Macrosteles quadrilineatus]|uniref:uncharacterized protein LOC128989604 n=1 Tax=Macrosteles quadrilineatus TaxID=74068 RepID=UPI0023E34BAA|nr:uncharacterized protein LOC128989604 [Macrosteles quadrilineatus]
MNSKIIYVLLVIEIKITAGAFGPKVGPYNIEFETLMKCEDEGSGKIVFATRITSAGNGTFFYNENFTLGVPIDENSKGIMELQKWGNGGWRKRSMMYTIKNCDELWKMIGDKMLDFFQFSNSSVMGCPIPQGTYKVENWPLHLETEKVVPVMEYGKYRWIMKIYYSKEFVGCIMGVLNIVPK